MSKTLKNKRMIKLKLMKLYNDLNSNIHIPKLEYIEKINTKFCIVFGPDGKEYVVQNANIRECGFFGCSSKMTAIIKQENISEIGVILSLADILLRIFLTFNKDIFLTEDEKYKFEDEKYKLFNKK